MSISPERSRPRCPAGTVVSNVGWPSRTTISWKIDGLWVAYYREQIEQSRAVTASMDLDSPCARTDIIECNVRYVLFHMIEETARHAGHADIIRESLDGSRGI